MSSPPPPLLCPSPTCNITVKNYRTAIAKLVNKLDMAAINAQLGIIIPLFGWTSFVDTYRGDRSCCHGNDPICHSKTWEKITGKDEEAESRGTSRRISPSDMRKRKNAATSLSERGSSAGRDNGFVRRLGGGAVGMRVVRLGVSFSTSLMKTRKAKGMGEWLLAITLFRILHSRIWWSAQG